MRVVCDDRLVVSNGFMLVPDHIEIDGEVAVEQYRLAHSLILVDGRGVATAYGYAFLDEAICDFSTDSVELAQNRLELHHPDVIDTIDEAIYNAKNHEEALLTLDGIQFAGDSEDKEHRLAVVDMQMYIDRAIDFDPALPYLLNLEGSVVVKIRDDLLQRTEEETVISGFVMAHGVRFLQTVEQPEEGELLIPHSWCTYHGSDRDNTLELYVPVSCITYFYALRNQYVSEQSLQ